MGSRMFGKAPLRRAIAVFRRESSRESLESGNGSLQMIEVDVEYDVDADCCSLWLLDFLLTDDEDDGGD